MGGVQSNRGYSIRAALGGKGVKQCVSGQGLNRLRRDSPSSGEGAKRLQPESREAGGGGKGSAASVTPVCSRPM